MPSVHPPIASIHSTFLKHADSLYSPSFVAFLHPQDLTFIDDGNDDTVSHAGSDLVNIEKQRMTVAVVDDLLAKRAETYCLHDVLTVQAYLDNCEKWDESAQYQKSLERAPRGGQRKKSRRLSISDMRSLSAHRERADGSEPSAMMEEGFIAELRQARGGEKREKGGGGLCVP